MSRLRPSSLSTFVRSSCFNIELSLSPNVPFNFLHPFSFICRFPPVGLSTTSCLYAVSISEFLLRPCASQQLPACIWFQYLGFPCLSTTSCAHLVSISNFPPCASHQTSLTSPASTTSCMHLVSVSKFPPPCARSKKRARDPAQCERL